MGSMEENPIYPMAPIIFYCEHIPYAKENESGNVFSLYIKLFGAKVDASCSMEPSAKLLVACLKFSWFMVVFFVYQFVYCRTLTFFWRKQNNRIQFFSQLARKSA
jgi:hypothetical protein